MSGNPRRGALASDQTLAVLLRSQGHFRPSHRFDPTLKSETQLPRALVCPRRVKAANGMPLHEPTPKVLFAFY